MLRIATNTTRRSGLATVKRILINVEFVRLEWLLVYITCAAIGTRKRRRLYGRRFG